ncbi:MAG: TolC family protein [Vicingus serpentipes]|nr:TolC family protein [Vicingus serpentipes]
MKKLIYILFLLFIAELNAQTLNDYLKIAAENNPGLKAKFKDYEASLEKVSQAGSLPDPVLDFGYFISPIETRNGPQQAKIGVMQMFPWMGTLNAKEQVFANMAKSKYEDFEARKKQLFYNVKKGWYELTSMKQTIDIIEANLQILKSFESLATQKFETGSKKGMVDVLRIQMEIAELENKLLLVKDKIKVKKVMFNNILNQDPQTTIAFPEKNEVLNVMVTKEQLMDSINSSNNELLSMEMKKEAFHSSSLVAKKQGLPMLGLGLNYFMIGESDMVVPNSGKDAFMPMISISIPIYRKKYNAQHNEANLNMESVQFQLENKKNMLENELEMTWVEYDDATRRITLYNQQNQKAKQALEIIVSGYANSGNDFEEILRIQRMMLNYDLQLITAVKDKNVAVAKMESMY